MSRTPHHLRPPAARTAAPNRATRAFCSTRLAIACATTAALLATAAQAGDILRGGVSAGQSRRNAEARAAAGTEAASAAQTRARDRLSRTTQAINDMRDLQAAARAAAGDGGVPDGLVPNGLDRFQPGDPNFRWDGANAPVQSGNDVTITQNLQQAVLHWKTLNVGKNTRLNFNQSAGGTDSGKWIAFNKVLDPTGRPSQIRGQIRADGQVYIINQNGIIFGAGSQVNARTLVASSLPFNEGFLERGLLNQAKFGDAYFNEFLFSSLPDGSFVPPVLPAGTQPGDIVVEPGAHLTATVNLEGGGGRVALVGPNVINQGTISTPAGQTILAAGLQVGFQPHNASDPSLRGLDTFVGAVGDFGGTVVNTGLIDIPTGSASLVGKSIEQLGLVDGLTSVSLNSRVDLLASYDAVRNSDFSPILAPTEPAFLPRRTGTVRLGPGALIRILPDFLSRATTVGTALPIKSQVNMLGGQITLEEGSAIIATNGTVSLQAGAWREVLESTDGNNRTLYRRGEPEFVFATGRIDIAPRALIDVSGSTNVWVALSQRIQTVQLRGSELAIAPLQRDSVIRGLQLTVDLGASGTYLGRPWIGTPLGDATGFLNLIERNAAQLTASAGTITLQAGASVATGAGSILDVSGGYFRNEGGLVRTTRLLYQGRSIVDVADALPDRVYDGIYSDTSQRVHTKWGVTRTFRNPLAPTGETHLPEMIAGADAGSISITAPVMNLAGETLGAAVVGPRQLRASSITSELPTFGSLRLSFTAQNPITVTGVTFPTYSPTPPAVVFTEARGSEAAIKSSIDVVAIASDFFSKSGFGSLEIENPEGDASLPSGVSVNLPANGSLVLSGRNIEIGGGISGPGANLAFTAHVLSPFEGAIIQADPLNPAPEFDPSNGTIRILRDARIITAGSIADDRPTSTTDPLLPFATRGGSISLVGYNVLVAPGSTLDVSGGLGISAQGIAVLGAAGSIEVAAGSDPVFASLLGGRLQLQGDLRGFAGSRGGSLAISAPIVQIGGPAPIHPDAFLVDPLFLSEGGFASFSFTGLGVEPTADVFNSLRTLTGNPAAPDGYLPSVVVASGVTIAPTLESLRYVRYGRDGQAELERVSRLPGDRTPVSITLAAPGVQQDFAGVNPMTGLPFTQDALKVRGDVLLGAGSQILLEPTASIRVSGQTVTALGTLSAPAGTIEIIGSNTFPSFENDPQFARPTVYLSPEARILSTGATRLVADRFGRRRGEVLGGGRITLVGNILTSDGSLLDVSGTTGVLDLTPGELGLRQKPNVPVTTGIVSPPIISRSIASTIESDGGSIRLTGRQMLFNAATMRGGGGGPTAAGGSLEVSSSRFYLPTDLSTTADLNLLVSQQRRLAFSPSSIGGTGFPVIAADGAALRGGGFFSVDQMDGGGFASLTLGGNLDIRGPVTISLSQRLSVADGGIIAADSDVLLQAPYVRLGQAFRTPLLPTDENILFRRSDPIDPVFRFAPTTGPGRIRVEALWVDLGTLSFENVGDLTVRAEGGSVRGNGSVQIAGSMSFAAAQVVPTTGVPFNLFAYDANGSPGSISFTRAGSVPAPLSAAGSINVHASVISQGGALVAPFGNIVLGWDGIGTAPVNPIAQNAAPAPVTSSLSLLSGSITSVSGIDPSTGRQLLIPYGVSFDGLNWIDPSGQNITDGALLPTKSIRLAGISVSTGAGSLVDIRGGGDVFAYRWVEGNGGPIDILAPSPSLKGEAYVYGTSPSYAVLPSYQDPVAPYAPFNQSGGADNLDNPAGLREPGYIHNNLALGNQVFLQGSPNLPAGNYTLLPARYALLPGAVLVTPIAGSPVGAVNLVDGSSQVGGRILNAFAPANGATRPLTRWEVAPNSVVSERAEYEVLLANEFLPRRAAALGLTAVARLPEDSGALTVLSVQGLRLQGQILGRPVGTGRGATADIATTADMLISSGGASGGVVLDAGVLSSAGIESLLLGGTRNGTTIDVRTSRITVANAGVPLTGADIILAARERLELNTGSAIVANEVPRSPNSYTIIGNGAAMRASGATTGVLTRSGTTTSTSPALVVGDGSSVNSASLTLDSSYGFSLSPSAALSARNLTFGAGQISLLLTGATPLTGDLAPGVPHLVIVGGLRQQLEAADSLSLRTYVGPLDIYGPGNFGAGRLGAFAVSAPSLRGFHQGTGTTTIAANTISLENPTGITAPAAILGNSGALAFSSSVFQLTGGPLAISQFANVSITASGGILLTGSGGLSTTGSLSASAPIVSLGKGATQAFQSNGALVFSPLAGVASVSSGLGGALSLTGSSVTLGSIFSLPSGILEARATGVGGDVIVSGRIDASGTSQAFFDQIRYSQGGSVSLTSDGGKVSLLAGSLVDVSAQRGGGNAGRVTISSPAGTFSSEGLFLGNALNGVGGTFALDAGSLPSFEALSSLLSFGGFTESRNVRVRTGDVTISGVTTVRDLLVSTDAGNILVTGTVRSGGATGGKIVLVSARDLTLAPGAVLDASAQNFSAAGKGGEVRLEAGAAINGVANTAALINIAAGSLVRLDVASFVPGSVTTPGSSAFAGQFTGTLHLRAPRTGAGAGTGIGISDIGGTILGASSILAEGFKMYQVAGGTISSALQSTINTEGQAYLGASGTAGANYTSILASVLASQPSLEGIFVLAPGAELVNPSGNLVLGTTSSTSSSDWNLASFRYGPKRAPGVLTLRASQDILFFNALSDGFTPTLASSNGSWLWLAPLSQIAVPAAGASALPLNTQSWSYRITAGADFSAADFRRVLPTRLLTSGFGGSVQVGKSYDSVVSSVGPNATTAASVSNRFQVVRTGTGSIDLSAGGRIRLMNTFSSIYTAGVRLPDYSTIFSTGDFSVPIILENNANQGALGTAQRTNASPYFSQYSMAGGNIRLSAGRDIDRVATFALLDDSSRQLPSNWLYRRGYVDPTTGAFGIGGFRNGPLDTDANPASTTWWVDFSNFFASVGALGGGDILLEAANDIRNIDAAIPTNARMPLGFPDASKLHELGGGDLVVRAGRTIDAGIFYVERGRGLLDAGASIVTNVTRSPSLGRLDPTSQPLDSRTWLPTTLFVGRSLFDVRARGDVLLGPVASSFLLPPGTNNRYWNKSYFTTFGPAAGANVTSFGGGITHRVEAQLPLQGGPRPVLSLWAETQLLLNNTSAANLHPWLRIAETTVNTFDPALTVMAPVLRSTAFAGDISLAGDLNLFPSPVGTLELLAAGAIKGLQPLGFSNFVISGQSTLVWNAATVNVSDASPASLPGFATPLSATATVGRNRSQLLTSVPSLFNALAQSFAETGSFSGASASTEFRQTLHAPGPLHAGDSNPLRLYAGSGNIEGFTLFSPKAARILAGQDIADIAFYVQNVATADISTIAAGRDILPYSESSPLRSLASRAGSSVAPGQGPMAGDLQISGPGVLEVLAGRNLDLGTGPNRPDGTGTGITSIGNFRNPFLPFAGADLIIAAGIGPATGLFDSALAIDAFLDEYGDGGLSTVSTEQRALSAIERFFELLREAAGAAAEGGSRSEGFASIESLFGRIPSSEGRIITQNRDIRTRTGGAISIVAPSGGVLMAQNIVGTPLLPPGIVTEFGGPIDIFVRNDVEIGKGRIFTLRGGDITIWSSVGQIAAGSAAKTVVTAPPTRVSVDTQSGEVLTDLAGLSTGGGIGVLASVEGIPPGNVILAAEVIDAGDAGIRATGNLTLAATTVLNADNISVAGTSAGVPTAPTVAAPNISGLTSGNTATSAASTAAEQIAQQATNQTPQDDAIPSVITVEVIGYGGNDETQAR